MDFGGSLNAECSYCGQPIVLAGLNTFDDRHHFCHLVCAKLYYDNVEKIKVNMTQYQKMYSSHQLSQLATEIYDKLNGTLFYMLPVSKTPSDSPDDRIAAKEFYINSFLFMKIQKVD